eukprot:29149-Pelagococcus_subviridis.AAC.4
MDGFFARAKNQPHDDRVSVHARLVQHGLLSDRPRVPVRASKQKLSRAAAVVPELDRAVQRRRAVLSRFIDHLGEDVVPGGPRGVREDSERLHVAVPRREVQRRVPQRVLLRLRRAARYQQLHDLHVPLARREMQRRVAVDAVLDVDVRARVEQQTRELRVAAVARDVHRGVSVHLGEMVHVTVALTAFILLLRHVDHVPQGFRARVGEGLLVALAVRQRSDQSPLRERRERHRARAVRRRHVDRRHCSRRGDDVAQTPPKRRPPHARRRGFESEGLLVAALTRVLHHAFRPRSSSAVASAPRSRSARAIARDPPRHAKCSGRSRLTLGLSSVAIGLRSAAARRNTSRNISGFPAAHAPCRHVFPSASGMKGSAPAQSSAKIASSRPRFAASSAGVTPPTARTSTIAAGSRTDARRRVRHAAEPHSAARCTGVRSSSPASIFAPSPRSSSTTRSWPRMDARCNAVYPLAAGWSTSSASPASSSANSLATIASAAASAASRTAFASFFRSFAIAPETAARSAAASASRISSAVRSRENRINDRHAAA